MRVPAGAETVADRSRGQFGALLRLHRQAVGLTQAQLAERAGMSQRGIADLERGARQFPYADTVRRLADALELPTVEHAALHAAARRPDPAATTFKPTRLPIEPSGLVGRERELSELQSLLEGARLLMLSGPAGIGKTRLALELARRVEANYPGGAIFVDLAPVTDHALVPEAMALAVGVHEQANKPLMQTVQDQIGSQHLLVVLDNCEHLLNGAAKLAHALVRDCPELQIVATSREPMRVRGEIVWPVPPLSAHEAHQLFMRRARAARATLQFSNRDTDRVAEICQRLDGIPLAIELAAARVPMLGVSQIADHLAE